MSFWRKMCYLRGIFGASSGRSGAEESCYKGTKKNRDMQVFYAIKFAYPKKIVIILLTRLFFYRNRSAARTRASSFNIRRVAIIVNTTFTNGMADHIVRYHSQLTVDS